MSELPAQLIAKYSKELNMIVPFTERGLSHGKTFGLGPSTYDFRCKQSIVLMPHRMYWRWRLYKLIDRVLSKLGMTPLFQDYHCGFALVSTVEKVTIPDFLSAVPMDKSTWIRQGITVHNTHFDPGFSGYPTIELANQGNDIVKIPARVAICQFKFTELSEPTNMPYRGKYQNQPDRPVEARVGTGLWS